MSSVDVVHWLQWIEASTVGTYVRTSTFAYPLVEIAHLVGVSTLFGTVLLVDLALLTGYRRVPLGQWASSVLRLTLAGFVLAAISGLLMLVARASEIALNPVFGAKMLLLVVAGVNAIVFHRRRGLTENTGGARAQVLGSLLIWVAVIACGRMIAYT